MKTTCFALLALVSLSHCAPHSSAKLTFLPAEELRDSPKNVKPPQDPATHVFPRLPTVPLLPVCMAEGYFRDPYNCGKFYECDGPKAVPYAWYCSPGLIFNMATNWCDYPEYVDC